MSDKPLPENLISGYLDNQLTPDERAEVEASLRDDVEAKNLLARLKQQSADFRSLPKYKLGAGFAEQMLGDARAEQAFANLAERRRVETKPAGFDPYPTSNRLRYALASIASLAALVLVTLFIQNPETVESVSVAKKAAQADEPEFAAAVESDSAVVANELQAGISYEAGKGAGQDRNSKSSMRFKSAAGSESASGLERSDENKNTSESKLPDLETRQEIESSKNSIKDEMKFSREFMQRSNEAAGSELEDDPAVVRDKRKQVPRPESQVQQDRSKIYAGADVLADSIDKTAAPDNSVANEIIEVDYTGGPEMLEDFKNALVRNHIALDDNSRADSQSVKDNEVPGSFDAARERGSRESGNKTYSVSSSQAFLITATPEQIVGLISDLNSNAQVDGFRLQSVPQSSSSIMGLPSQSIQDQARTDADEIDEELVNNQPAGNSEGQSGFGGGAGGRSGKDKRRNATRFQDAESMSEAEKAQVSRGLAQQLSRLSELREKPMDSPIGGKELQLRKRWPAVQSIDERNEKEKLFAYFGQGAARKYLLLVRTGEHSQAAQDSLENSDAAPLQSAPKK